MDRITLLSNIPLFEEVARADLEALVPHFDDRKVGEGAELFHEGSDGSTLFLIEEGAIEISVGEGKARAVLATLYPGQFLGELSLFDGQPRSATATAVKPSTLIALSR